MGGWAYLIFLLLLHLRGCLGVIVSCWVGHILMQLLVQLRFFLVFPPIGLDGFFHTALNVHILLDELAHQQAHAEAEHIGENRVQ